MLLLTNKDLNFDIHCIGCNVRMADICHRNISFVEYPSLQSCFLPFIASSGRTTRAITNNCMKLPNVKSERPFSVSGPVVWNNIPKKIHDNRNYNSFKNQICKRTSVMLTTNQFRAVLIGLN